MLFVEDNELLARSTMRVLRRLKHEVTWAADAPSAMKLLEQETYDAILCDLALGDATGIPVLEVAKRRGVSRRVLISGTDEDPGGDHLFISKPLDPKKLEGALS